MCKRKKSSYMNITKLNVPQCYVIGVIGVKLVRNNCNVSNVVVIGTICKFD